MADYNKATNFTAKDSLPTGNAGKIVKGTEIDTELTAVSNAIASKANINSPTLTGTPAGPTASAGSNTTQLATTAFVKTAVDTATASLGTMSTQNANAVAITGGTIVGITDLAVADGGTGRSTLAANAVLVGNGTSGINSVAPGTSGNVLVSDGTAWTSNTIQGSSIELGLGTTGEAWNNVTGSRALGTTYTNSRGYPIMISITGTASGASGIFVNVNGTEVYRNQAQWNGPGAFPGAVLIIPNGATYSATMSTSGLSTWYELY